MSIARPPSKRTIWNICTHATGKGEESSSLPSFPVFFPGSYRLLTVFMRYRWEHEHILQVSLQVYRSLYRPLCRFTDFFPGRFQVDSDRFQVDFRLHLLHLPAESEG